MNALLRWSQANPLDEEVAYALSQGWGTQIPDPEFAKARRARQNLALRGYDTYQEPQSVNALSPIVSGSDQASFLRSEKDTRPYYETDQRGMVAPLVKSGYNDSVALANPVVTGGSAPSILNDILQGRQVDKGEIQQAAGDAAGAAMTGSLALSRPSGSIGSGGRIASELPMDQASRMARAKEMGFDTDTIYYHGTPTAGFNEFEARAPKIAGDIVDNKAVYGSTLQSDANLYAGASDGSAVIPFMTRAKMASLDEAKGIPADRLVDALRERGFGGYFQTGGKTYASIFDPKDIRSVNAAFDPEMASSANLLAANAPTSAAAPSVQHIAQTAAREQAPGIRAYHGSPHDFDRFDLSKIGTGEGAQAFGHGLYFAESKGTADFYRQKLSSDGGDRISRSSPTYMADTANEVGKGDQAAALAWLQSEIRKLGSATTPVTAERRNAALEAVKLIEEGRKPMPPNGRMYEVNIKADPNDFLDWDKPLSQQPPKVMDAFKAVGRGDLLDEVNPYTARDALEKLGTRRLKDGQPSYEMMNEASAALREAGIPGIKYLDQGSRTAGGGSRNYVVFDDALVEILRKYGLAGLGVLGASGLGTQDAQAEPLRASDNVISEPFYNALLGVQAMGNGYQPGPVQSDYVIDRRNEDPEGVYQSDRVGFRRRVPSADTMPPELRFLLPRP